MIPPGCDPAAAWIYIYPRPRLVIESESTARLSRPPNPRQADPDPAAADPDGIIPSVGAAAVYADTMDAPAPAPSPRRRGRLARVAARSSVRTPNWRRVGQLRLMGITSVGHAFARIRDAGVSRECSTAFAGFCGRTDAATACGSSLDEGTTSGSSPSTWASGSSSNNLLASSAVGIYRAASSAMAGSSALVIVRIQTPDLSTIRSVSSNGSMHPDTSATCSAKNDSGHEICSSVSPRTIGNRTAIAARPSLDAAAANGPASEGGSMLVAAAEDMASFYN